MSGREVFTTGTSTVGGGVPGCVTKKHTSVPGSEQYQAHTHPTSHTGECLW